MPAEVTAYRVVLADRVVGRIYQRGDHTWLEWQEGYWDDPMRPVLGLAFENEPRARVSSALRLPPWFSNLLPEGRLRDWVARDVGVSPEREMLLLSRLGHDLPGGVRVEEAEGDIDSKWRPDIVALRSTGEGTLTVGRPRLRFSLAGVALKFSMLQRGDRLTLPARDEEGDWIVKMPDAVYPSVPQNEFAMMSLASRVGIERPEIRLMHRDELPALPDAAWPQNQQWAYAVRRFDRTPQGRVHIEDMAQVRGFYPEHKYRGSFDTVAALVYRRRDLPSYLEFARRLFFSYAIGNGDMHLKNVSLIYHDARRPMLTPAYDLVSTAPYLPSADDEDLGLKLGRSRRLDTVTLSSFRRLAERVGAPVEHTEQVIVEVARRLDEWASVRDNLVELPEHLRWLDARLPAIAERFRR